MRDHNNRAAAQLRDLHEEVHADREEEREAPRELVDAEPARGGRARVFKTVGEREAELLHRGRARLLHVIAGDRDRVELRHVLRRVLNDVGHDPHARLGRIDVGVADHELFEDVVLDGPAELALVDALLFAGNDVTREHGQHRAVHRHRHRHLVERDAVEEQLHVLDRIDRDTGLADVADDARVVAVVSPVRREVERDRQSHLPRREVLAVERVRLFRGGEARVLPDRPRPVRVHRRPRPADERLHARQPADGLEALEVVGRVERLDRNALGRLPDQRVGVTAAQLARGEGAPVVGRG